MKPSRVEEVLSHLLHTRWPAFIWGPPGVGKSSIVRKVAKDRGLDILDIRASLLDPTDLRGIPTVENGMARWCPPSFLPSDKDSKGIIFFDELNAAPPLVQASLYQLTLDRRVGEYCLPDGWRILAAGNRAEDKSITFRMPAALSNRFVHLDYEVSMDDWSAWAIKKGIHPLVLGFLTLRQELLFNMSGNDKAFPSPRSWEMVSDVIKQIGNTNNSHDIILGIVGEGATTEFLAYSDNVISEELLKKIIADPETADLPDSLSDQYALISYFSSTAKGNKAVQKAASIILHRLSPELSILLLRNTLHAAPKFMLEKEVKRFMTEHKELVL
jgi:midasin (ATPase involved in ribosome maturation)